MLTYHGHKAERGAAGLFWSPVLGLIYILTLPLVTILTVMALMGKRVLSCGLGLLRSLAYFGWMPSEVYLSGKRRRGNR